MPFFPQVTEDHFNAMTPEDQNNYCTQYHMWMNAIGRGAQGGDMYQPASAPPGNATNQQD
jgi:hypothetical protein